MTVVVEALGWAVLLVCIAFIVRAELRGEGVFNFEREEDLRVFNWEDLK